jgi:hypothetical protein
MAVAMICGGQLILKRAAASRPSGQWSDDDYDVLADGVVIGRIMNAAATHRRLRRRWQWRHPLARRQRQCGHLVHERQPASGHAAAAPPSNVMNSRRMRIRW